MCLNGKSSFQPGFTADTWMLWKLVIDTSMYIFEEKYANFLSCAQSMSDGQTDDVCFSLATALTQYWLDIWNTERIFESYRTELERLRLYDMSEKLDRNSCCCYDENSVVHWEWRRWSMAMPSLHRAWTTATQFTADRLSPQLTLYSVCWMQQLVSSQFTNTDKYDRGLSSRLHDQLHWLN